VTTAVTTATEPEDEVAAEAEPEPEPETEPVAEPVVEETSVASASEPEGTAQVTPVAQREPERLEVLAVEKSWVQVKADDGRPRARMFEPSERRTYEAREKFLVKLGNAGGVRLFWNEEALKVPGKPAEVVTLSFPEALDTLRP
jgi:hypothetical protein